MITNSGIFSLVNTSDMVKGFARRFSLCDGLRKLSRGFPQNLITLYVRLRVELGDNIREREDFPLRWASEKGHLEVVKYLVGLRHQALLRARSACAEPLSLGWAALVRKALDLGFVAASSEGHLKVVEYLVSVGASVCAFEDLGARLASENGHLEVVKYLASVGADVRACNDQGVALASENGHREVVKYLVGLRPSAERLSVGADIAKIARLTDFLTPYKETI